MNEASIRILAIYSSTLALSATFLTGVMARVPFGTGARRAVVAAAVGWLAGSLLGKIWFRLTEKSDEEQGTRSPETSLGRSVQTDEHSPDQP